MRVKLLPEPALRAKNINPRKRFDICAFGVNKHEVLAVLVKCW